MNKFLIYVGCLLFSSQNVFANTYAIVVGIDSYQNYPSLEGAVNDASLLADAFNKSGAKKVNLLLNEKASRDEIKKAWDEILAQAKAGDTVFMTYAGHGSQLPERVKGSEADGQDEFYVLSNFGESDGNTYERVIDDDLREWFSKRPDLQIILVSDSCHSGTMTRVYARQTLKYRKASVKHLKNDVLPVSKNKDIVDERKTKLAHVSYFSGVSDDKEVPEVMIDNQPHGALSVYLAKGLLGAADNDKDGSISLTELKGYITQKVVMETDGQQHPEVSVEKDTVVASVDPNASRPDLLNGQVNPADQSFDKRSIKRSLQSNHSLVVLQGEMPSISFSIINGNGGEALIMTGLVGIKPEKPEKSDLVLDLKAKVLRNKFNDIVYHLPNASKVAESIQPVINKHRFIYKVANSLSDGSLVIKLLPDDKIHHKGEVVSFEISNLRYKYFTLINLAIDGTVNFLYPSQKQDSLEITSDKPFSLDLEVSVPFGADHMLAITSDKPLTSLHEALKKMNNTLSSVDEFKKLLNTALADINYQISTHATVTEN